MARQVETAVPLRQAALLFALLGCTLLGVYIGGLLDAMDTADVTQRQGVEIAPSTVPMSSGVLLAATTVLLGSTVLLLLRSRRAAIDATVRDPATELYLPAFVDEAVDNLAARDDRNGSSQLAVVTVEIGYLDEVRRRYGRDAVEILLRFTGRQIRGQSREGDLPMRDGDGFVIYLQCAEPGQAVSFCRRLEMLLSREQIEIGGDILKVSPRMRVAQRRTGESIADLRRRAAEADPLALP